MNTFVILVLAVALLCGLLFAEKKDNLKGILLTKPILSGLFIATALSQPHHAEPYFYLILTGLVFCFAGDICLAFFFKRRGLYCRPGILSRWPHFLRSGVFHHRRLHNRYMCVPRRYVCHFLVCIYKAPPPPRFHDRSGYRLYCHHIPHGCGSGLTCRLSRLQPSRPSTGHGGVTPFLCFRPLCGKTQVCEKNIINRYLGLPMYYAAQFMLAFSVGMIP